MAWVERRQSGGCRCWGKGRATTGGSGSAVSEREREKKQERKPPSVSSHPHTFGVDQVHPLGRREWHAVCRHRQRGEPAACALATALGHRRRRCQHSRPPSRARRADVPAHSASRRALHRDQEDVERRHVKDRDEDAHDDASHFNRPERWPSVRHEAPPDPSAAKEREEEQGDEQVEDAQVKGVALLLLLLLLGFCGWLFWGKVWGFFCEFFFFFFFRASFGRVAVPRRSARLPPPPPPPPQSPNNDYSTVLAMGR
jgi:hypothetical protein